jgi:probable phosphomutase (TIGR03848 family)
MTTVLLIRHASNDYLKDNRMAGLKAGVHLNEQGQREADALARRLGSIALAAIYSSPLERARETAQAIAQSQKLVVQIHPGLIEVDVGDWTDRQIAELQATDAWKQMQARPLDFCFPNGESNAMMHARIVATIDALVAAHPQQTIALVSHADPIKIALAHYLGMNLNDFERLAIEPASVSVLQFDQCGVVLSRLNDTGQLDVRKEE